MTLSDTEISPLGFSKANVLTVAVGSYTAPLLWNEPPAELASSGPERGVGSVTLGVEVTTPGARFVHWVPRAGRRDINDCGPDEVQFDAQVSFVTAGGAFAERFPAVLHATRADSVQIELRLKLTALNGSFEISPRAGVRTDSIVLDATITPEGTSGALRGQLVQTSGTSQSARFVTYACWPAGTDACLGP